MRASRQRIALNAQLLRLNSGYRSAGIARYIWHLLLALPDAANEFELHAYTGEAQARQGLRRLELHLTRWQTENPTARILWEQFIFPLQLAQGDFELCHGLAFASPLTSRIRSIVTVYDTSFILYPKYFRAANRIYLKWVTRESVVRAERVIAISESTRRDLVRLFNVSEDKIDVIPPGVEPEFSRPDNKDETLGLRTRHRLPEHFVLFVGTHEPRKNIPMLIRAFAHAKTRAHLPHQLVIAGGRGWLSGEIEQAIQQTGMQQEVLRPGFIPEAELPLWYRAADAFVYPSQYEGFGMPPLEALASGTPVITTNCSALPEAVGDTALLIGPRDEDGLAEALNRLLTDATLRAELSSRGRERARMFTWERTAIATAQVYRRVLGSQGKQD